MIARGFLGLSALLSVAGCLPDFAATTVTIRGSGAVEVDPDSFVLEFRPSASAGTQTEAIQAMTAQLEAIKSDLPRLEGLTAITIETESVNVRGEPSVECAREFDRSANTYCDLELFRASVGVVVRAQPAEQAGNLVSLATELTRASINAPRFYVKDSDEHQRQALKKAVDNARERAELLGEATGLSVTGIASVEPPQRVVRHASTAPGIDAAEPSLDRRRPIAPIELVPSPIIYSTSIDVTFKLEPARGERGR